MATSNSRNFRCGKLSSSVGALHFFEYCLMVPANRIGSENGMNGFQLKMTQEVITLVVFTVFAIGYLKEPFHWRYLVSFLLLLGAVYFMFKK